MEAANIIDVILGIFLFIFFIIHLRKGLVASVLHLAGLILTVLLVHHIGYDVKEMVIAKFQFSNTLATILAYILIILAVMLVTKIVIYIIHKVVSFLNLSAINKILGGIFGLANGILVISILLIVIDISPFLKNVRPVVNESFIVQFTRKVTGSAKESIPKLQETEKKAKEYLKDKTS
jgi:membrane protein required for colicin V production